MSRFNPLLGYEWSPPPLFDIPEVRRPLDFRDRISHAPLSWFRRIVGIVSLLSGLGGSPTGLVLSLLLLPDVIHFVHAWRDQKAYEQEVLPGHTTLSREYREAFNNAPRWYPVEKIEPSLRIDVVGGSMLGWSHLLASVADSTGRRVTLVDCTGQPAHGEILSYRNDGDAFILEHDPLVGMERPSDALLTFFAETDERGRDYDADRIVLGSHVDEALSEGGWTLERASAALLSLAGDSRIDNPCADALRDFEHDVLERISARPSFNSALSDSASRMAGLLRPVIRAREGRKGADTQAMMKPFPWFGSRGSQAFIARAEKTGRRQSERYSRLLIASLSEAIRGSDRSGELIAVLGAESLGVDVLEELISQSDSHGVAVVLFFERFNETAKHFAGSRSSGILFARLNSSDEAQAAARFIGEEVKFILSSRSQSTSASYARSESLSFFKSSSQGSTRSSGWSGGPEGHSTYSSGHSSGTNEGSSQTYGRTVGGEKGNSQTYDRTIEFVVRPEQIHRLPETLLIYRGLQQGEAKLALVEVDESVIGTHKSPVPIESPHSWERLRRLKKGYWVTG